MHLSASFGNSFQMRDSINRQARYQIGLGYMSMSLFAMATEMA